MSERFSLDKEQIKMILKQFAKYTAPLLLTFLVALQGGVPVKDALWLVYGAGLQLAINIVSKFVASN